MALFQNILVAVDFSAHSRAAIDLAVKIAKDGHAKLHLLHCYPIQPGGISPYGIALPADYYTEIRDAAGAQLKEWRDQYVPADVEAEELLSSEAPSLAISQAAEAISADLVVMGTRGLSGIKHVMLGSTAERTVRSAPCPVLTVKTDD